MTKHAPGPWQVAKVDKKHIYINDCNDIYIAQVGLDFNAHLIATAPELLEACIDLIEQVKQAQKGFIRYNDSPTMNAVIIQAEQAITKAEGEK